MQPAPRLGNAITYKSVSDGTSRVEYDRLEGLYCVPGVLLLDYALMFTMRQGMMDRVDWLEPIANVD